MYFHMLSLGFTGQIKLYGFARIFSELKGEHLDVFERQNCISLKFKFFETLFIQDNSVSSIQKNPEQKCIFSKSYIWIVFSDKLYASISPNNITERELNTVRKHIVTIGSYPTVVFSSSLCSSETSEVSDDEIIKNTKFLPLSEFRQKMRHYLRYTDTSQTKINDEKTKFYKTFNFPESFDIGVHIRTGDKITTGEMKFIPMERYIEMIKQNTSKTAMNIFVMTDSGQALQEFKTLADPLWNIYSTTTLDQCAHIQDAFNDSPITKKIEELYRIMAEIEIMKTIPTIFCTLTSNIGFLIYFIHPLETPDIISIDKPYYIFASDSDKKFS